MLYVALLLMTVILVTFSIAWYLSPALREKFEEPKYRIFDHTVEDHE